MVGIVYPERQDNDSRMGKIHLGFWKDDSFTGIVILIAQIYDPRKGKLILVAREDDPHAGIIHILSQQDDSCAGIVVQMK